MKPSFQNSRTQLELTARQGVQCLEICWLRKITLSVNGHSQNSPPVLTQGPNVTPNRRFPRSTKACIVSHLVSCRSSDLSREKLGTSRSLALNPKTRWRTQGEREMSRETGRGETQLTCWRRCPKSTPDKQRISFIASEKLPDNFWRDLFDKKCPEGEDEHARVHLYWVRPHNKLELLSFWRKF